MTTPEDNSQKKGRPTPKRKDAQASTKFSSLAPASTKAEKARAKEAARASRIAQRAAYLRGDESALPARDRGPEKKLVRNLVDSRRSIGEYFLPVIGFVLILSLIPIATFAVAGIIFFGVNDPWHWNGVVISMLTLIRIATLDNWGDVFYINFFGCDVYSNGYYTSSPIPTGSGYFGISAAIT
jgi:hypothetical protein